MVRTIALTFLFVFVLGTVGIDAQILADGRIDAIFTDQPCLRQSADNSPTKNMDCNKATTVAFNVVPTQSDTTNSVTFQFASLPDTDNTGSTTFQGSGDQTHNCDSSQSSKQCLTSIGGDLLNIDIFVSKITARWTLEETGITIPFAYYYNTSTTPFANYRAGMDQCKVTGHQLEGVPASSGVLAFKNPDDNTANDGVTQKFSELFGATGKTIDDVFAQYIMGAEPFSQAYRGWVSDQSAWTEVQTSSNRASDVTGIDEIWPDDIYRRWIYGLLGAGGTVESGKEVPDKTTDCPDQDAFSTCTCVNPIDSTATTRPTQAVCPGGPVQGGYGARNGENIESLSCWSGNCAGNQEAKCVFELGFTHGSTRCLGSRETAAKADTDGCPHHCEDKRFTRQSSCDNHDQFSDYECTCAGLCDTNEKKCRGIVYDELTLELLEREDFCYCTMRRSLCATATENTDYRVSGDGFRSHFYPAVNQLYFQAKGITDPSDIDFWTSTSVRKTRLANQYNTLKMCSVNDGPWINFDSSNDPFQEDPNDEQPWRKMVDNQLVCCNSEVFGDPQSDLGQFGGALCGKLDLPNIGGLEPTEINCLKPRLGDSPCDCACQSAWTDVVVPVNPLCTVYRIRDPAEAMYNVTVRVTPSDGSAREFATVGTSTFINGEVGAVISNVTDNGRVGVRVGSLKFPRGNSAPRLGGYIVICGDRKQVINDDVVDQTTQRIDRFVGSASVLGTDNPFRAAAGSSGMDVKRRAPLPSTYEQLEDIGALKDIARSFLGKGTQRSDGTTYKGQPSWWYYVPPERMRNYGQGCNQIGWNNYGAYDPPSAAAMCSGRTGSCVPGYDFSGTANITEAMIRPPVQVPAFVARTFVEYEMKSGSGDDDNEIPVHLPPNTNAGVLNYWVDGNYLYSDSDAKGEPVFASGSVEIPIELSVAGTLLQDATSLSGGKLEYPDGNEAPSRAPSDPTNTPLGACQIGLANSRGGLNVRIVNTGKSAASYSVRLNCTNTIVQDGSTDNIGVEPGSTGVLVGVRLIVSSLADINTGPTCEVSLLASDIESAVLDTLPYNCYVVNNVNYGAGGVVTGNPPPVNLGEPPHGGGGGGGSEGGGGGFWDIDFPVISLWGLLKAPWNWIVTIITYIGIFAAVILFFLLLINLGMRLNEKASLREGVARLNAAGASAAAQDARRKAERFRYIKRQERAAAGKK